MTDRQIAATFCRLCSNKIQEDPVRMPTQPSCPKVEIIRQHYGIQVVISAEQSEVFVCQQCWTTTDQFHQLYTTVQQNEAVLVREALFVASPRSAAIKTEDSKPPPTSLPANPYTGVSLIECKVEINDETREFDDEEQYPDADSIPGSPMSPSSASSSSSSSDRDESPVRRRKKTTKKAPPTKRKKASPSTKRTSAPAVANAAPKRKNKKFTADEIFDQNVRVREYFQMQCELCDTQFSLLHEAIKHYRREHDQPGYLRCCGKKFFTRTLVLDHIQYHADPNAFHCARCARSYISQAALKLHMVSHNEQLPKPHKCVVCGLEFVKYFQLTQHQRQKHVVTTQKSFGCDICGKFFYTKWQTSTHIHSAHIAAHICDICAQSFKNKVLLDMHYRRVHIGEIRPKVQCSICGSWLADERCLRLHIARHDQQVPVPCPICGKLTPNKHALGNHMRYVHSERQFKCSICDKSFKRAIALREHVAAHTGVDLYTCTYCTRTFKSKSNMFTHRKKAHPIEWNRDREQRNQPM